MLSGRTIVQLIFWELARLMQSFPRFFDTFAKISAVDPKGDVERCLVEFNIKIKTFLSGVQAPPQKENTRLSSLKYKRWVRWLILQNNFIKAQILIQLHDPCSLGQWLVIVVSQSFSTFIMLSARVQRTAFFIVLVEVDLVPGEMLA
jgi:hypothetical protein